MFPASTSQNTLFGLGFHDVPFGSQPFTTDAPAISSADVNSPEGFKQSIHLVQQHLVRIQGLARSILAGIEHAYQPGTNPMQTAADAEILKQALGDLSEVLKQTGVGALPVVDLANLNASMPNEEKMLADAKKATDELHGQLSRLQGSASTVVSRLTALEQGVKR